jgi:hypothetical protein
LNVSNKKTDGYNGKHEKTPSHHQSSLEKAIVVSHTFPCSAARNASQGQGFTLRLLPQHAQDLLQCHNAWTGG